jgi:hypothetical protein
MFFFFKKNSRGVKNILVILSFVFFAQCFLSFSLFAILFLSLLFFYFCALHQHNCVMCSLTSSQSVGEVIYCWKVSSSSYSFPHNVSWRKIEFPQLKVFLLLFLMYFCLSPVSGVKCSTNFFISVNWKRGGAAATV